MIWKRVILSWMTLLALVFASAGASARTDVSPKPHVRAIDLVAAICIEASGLASAEGHRGNWDPVTTETSDIPYAARAVPNIAKLGYDANRLNHVFQAKHMLEPLVAKLGSQEAALAAMHRAVQPLVKQGYQTGSWVTVKIGEHAVSIKGAVIDGVFKVSTATMRPF